MQINNLTPEQCEMLDIMWNELDSEEEYFAWYDSLSPEKQREAELLQRLVIMESIDDEMLQENNTSFAEANAVLDKFRL